jgi:hypothetical protein
MEESDFIEDLSLRGRARQFLYHIQLYHTALSDCRILHHIQLQLFCHICCHILYHLSDSLQNQVSYTALSESLILSNSLSYAGVHYYISHISRVSGLRVTVGVGGLRV